MYLKQLEILGFKSFAQKTQIDFVPGVTAVVGPNGSGKSNITDAIKWVLGEQSAKSLRGAKMEDIIFAGSDAKRPLNMAEVTLVLDNNDRYMNVDYTEISVTRRVFRSGESEFLLNGQKCRLKDIVDLFMDSGLGREAYSIISQGKIDDILNSKAEEKRKIFEEAAGVLKYKTRKISAEKKLDESQEHLNRVEDILYELEGQVEPLEEQASIAKDYLEKKAELESVEVALLAHDIGVTHEKWEQHTKNVQELQEKSLAQAGDISKHEAHQEKLRSHLQALDQSVEELQEALLLSSELLEKYEGEKKVLAERQKHAEENAEQLQERIATLKEKKEAEEQLLSKEKTARDQHKAKLDELKKDLQTKTHRLNHFEEDIEQHLEQLKSDYFELLNQQAAFRNEMRYLGEQQDLLERKNDRVVQDYQSIQTKKDELESKKAEAEAHAATIDHALEEKTKSYQELLKGTESYQEKLDKLRGTLQQMEQYIQRAESRLEMLKEMEDDFAGFYGGVKTVLKAREKQLKGIHGAVAELIRVNKTYEVAVETALGAAMQHVVVESETHAQEAIRYLKAKKAGRATFLPLSVIKPRHVSEGDLAGLRGHEAFVGTGAALVTYDNRYHAIVGHLLGTILVAKDLRGATALAKKVNYRYRIVTLDGDVISPGGAMSGGSRKQTTTNLLGRQREIEQLDKQLKEMKTKKAEHEAAVTSNRTTFQELRKKAEVTHKEMTQFENAQREKRSEIKEIQFELRNVNERLVLIQRDQKGFADENGEISERLQGLQKQLEEVSAKQSEMNEEIETITHQKKNQDETKSLLQNEITELKVAVAREQESYNGLEEKVQRLSRELAAITSDLKEAETTIRVLDQSLSGQKLDHKEILRNIETARQDKQAITHWIGERRGRRLNIHDELQDGEREVKELKRLHRGTEEQLRREEIALERLDVALDNLINNLREEYELGYETAKEKYPLELEAEEARKQVKLLKRAIEELGAVNLGAIEEYERVSTRFKFLTDQREDLLQAKETLLGVIDEMDDEVRVRFKETFEQVRDHFSDVFKALFGGGKANLVLTDPEDLLYSGVDILAQPPGKKLQHLSLLSGGERALTAIALLFAILKVRPVPFCVLDEVEAALDDANVDRYAQFLKDFSHETQFIVVTHRKGTMENADVLYGVTMQESGISKLVSVRLEETKELVG
ncbi:chromosome segregation protein [Pullulanibacillus pueri]|uniref:Chromosome partition protein Smc n=1 Tax=Pullulanibacillus pueri TaxID=1437324 RepID=A0A8J3EL23_9BACL|nr:chromosome segregation protein SMC [Pullulanibacillus pueri]MBM7680202.1 chromosome segregation protein [Pullulanibacillus pueri]GGH74872.1 chromosome partition protein Smc [Pullulanibacillus pueri]